MEKALYKFQLLLLLLFYSTSDRTCLPAGFHHGRPEASDTYRHSCNSSPESGTFGVSIAIYVCMYVSIYVCARIYVCMYV